MVCIAHDQCWFFFRGDCVSAIHQISSTCIGMSEREGQDPPWGGDDARGGELLPRERLVVNSHDDPGCGTILDCLSCQLLRLPDSPFLPTVIDMRSFWII